MEKDHGCAAIMANNIQDDVGVHGAKINVGVNGVPFDTTPVGGDVHREVEASCANDVGTSASLRFDATPGGDGMWDMHSIDFSFGYSECFVVTVFVL